MNPNPYNPDEAASRGAPLAIYERSPSFVLLMTLVTCGLYLFYWYYQIYDEMERVHGISPTGNAYFIDLLLVFVTCGLWGIYVDYEISNKLNDLQARYGMYPNDTTTTAILLDLAAFFVGLTNIVTSMIQQDQFNKVREAMASGRKASDPMEAASTQKKPNYTEGQSPRADNIYEIGRKDENSSGGSDYGSFGNKDDNNPYS